ncbi:DUF3747 domain-containing protein [Egbenema bharatensis]|uniref:DUF3747 domain-containing protein n=1 Tax=Egbenema bharatensis TaxID=3463334 RepID=UPI003A839CEC
MRLSFRKLTAIAAITALLTILFTSRPVPAATFGQREVDQSRFIAIAAPVSGGAGHQLLILEQLTEERPCWREFGSQPVIVDPVLTNFDFTGICGRSTDSNGYSVRVNGQDMGLDFNLRVLRRDNDLRLYAVSGTRGQNEIEIGRAYGTTSDFARIYLNPGWRFTKRTLDDRTLGHVYLTYEGQFPPAPIADLTPPPAPESFAFRDIANDTYVSEIQQAVQIGFISGFEDNTFRPRETLTREQLVSMVLEALVRVPGLNVTLPNTASSSPYRDVDAGRWSAAKIQFAQQNNIVSGYEDGTFRPTQAVTRAEMMAVLRRAAEYAKSRQGVSTELQPTQQTFTFSDTSGHWAESLISQMSAYCGVATPLNEAGTAFAPNTGTQRNYAAAATLRMLECNAPQTARN